MRRLMFGMLLVGLAAGVLLAADQWATSWAQERTAEQVSDALGAPAQVRLEGWPVGLRLLWGHVPKAVIVAQDVPIDDEASIERLDVVLIDVRVRRSDLEEGRLPPARDGRFRARVEEASVRELVGWAGRIVDVRLHEGGLQLALGGVHVEADVVAERGNVSVRPEERLFGFLGVDGVTIDLSDQPGSPYVEDVATSDRALVLVGVLQDVRERGRLTAGSGG